MRRGADPSRRCVAAPKNHLRDEAKESHQARNQAENKELHELRRAGRTGRRSRAQNTRDSRNWRSSLDERKLEPSNQLNSLSMNQAQKVNHLSSEQSQSPKSEPSQAEPEGLLKSQAEAKSSPKSLPSRAKQSVPFLFLSAPSPAPGVAHALVLHPCSTTGGRELFTSCDSGREGSSSSSQKRGRGFFLCVVIAP